LFQTKDKERGIMNILIIADNFLKGGLETHIYTLYKNLNKDNKFYFAFGKFNSELPLKNVEKDFNFGINSSIDEFCSDVDRLVKIIQKNKINVINVQPFYSIFPAIFAAHLTGIPIVYTYHGKGSYNFVSKCNDTILFNYAFESTIKKVLCVTQNGIEGYERMNYSKAQLLPNPIDTNVFKETKIQKNKKWAIISRLDNDKYEEIIKLFSWLPKLDINSIDVYGSGNREEDLKNYVSKNKLKVNFLGYSDNIYEMVSDKYTGLIGIGRAVLESLAQNYPTILIGFGKIGGVIDKNLYELVSKYNFVPNYCNEITLEDLQKQIKDINNGKYQPFLLRNKIIEDFDSKIICKRYLELLKVNDFYVLNNIKELYLKIKDLIPFGDGNQKIYESINVYYLLKNYIEYSSLNINLKNFFISMDYTINNKLEIQGINQKLMEESKND
jgi:hypothetical protein